MCNYLESKYLEHSNFEDTINIARFLDPRFKAQHLGEEVPMIKHCVTREGVELLGSQSINAMGVSGKAGHGQDTDANSDADTNSDPM